MRRIVLFLFLSLFCLVSCRNEGADGVVEISNSSDDTLVLLNDVVIEFDSIGANDNLICYSGTIDNQYEIYLEYSLRWPGPNAIGLWGYYFYQSNNIGFNLDGIQEGSYVTLERKVDLEVDETFDWEFDNDMNVTGHWYKTGKDQLDIQLRRINTNSSKTEQFLAGVKQIIDDPMSANLTMDYSIINDLKFDTSLKGADFEGSFCGDKIYMEYTYESSSGGLTEDIIYALLRPELQTEKNNETHILQLECQNGWDNDYGDYSVDEDDQYGLEPWYLVTATVFSLEADKCTKIQQILLNGDGEAEIYYFNEKIVMRAGDRKEVLFYSPSEKAFVEH
jgi:hypothetical protein